MTAGVVGNDGVRHAVLAEFPRGELCALAARARLVHPNVDGDAGIVRGVNGRSGRSMIHEGKPTGVAMCEDIHRRADLAPADATDEREPVPADCAACRGIFICDQSGSLASDGNFRARSGAARDGRELAIHGPCEIHGGGACGFQKRGGFGEAGVCRAAACIGKNRERGEVHPPPCRCPDEPRATDVHLGNRRGHLRDGGDFFDHEAVRQRALIDDLDGAPVAGPEPDGAVVSAVDVHRGGACSFPRVPVLSRRCRFTARKRGIEAGWRTPAARSAEHLRSFAPSRFKSHARCAHGLA